MRSRVAKTPRIHAGSLSRAKDWHAGQGVRQVCRGPGPTPPTPPGGRVHGWTPMYVPAPTRPRPPLLEQGCLSSSLRVRLPCSMGGDPHNTHCSDEAWTSRASGAVRRKNRPAPRSYNTAGSDDTVVTTRSPYEWQPPSAAVPCDPRSRLHTFCQCPEATHSHMAFAHAFVHAFARAYSSE